MSSFRVLAASLLFAAKATLAMQGSRHNTTKPSSRCGPVETKQAMVMLRSSATGYTSAHGNPCLSDMADLYEARMEDPSDAAEFLGNRARIDNLDELTCRKKLIPAFLYLGMEHAGSTTLADHIDQHQELSFGRCKEHRFWTKFGDNLWSSNTSEYLDEFEVGCEVQKTFDATPNMFALPLRRPREECHAHMGALGKGPEAMQELVSSLGIGTQLLVMLRDPAKVAASRYPRRSFGQHVEYAVNFCKCFYTGLTRWMEYFPKKQFFFILSDELFKYPQHTLNSVFDFLGVPHKNYRGDIVASGRRRVSSSSMATSMQKLHYREAIKPCQTNLAKLTGLNLKWGL